MAAQAVVITPRQDPWEMALRQYNVAAEFRPSSAASANSWPCPSGS